MKPQCVTIQMEAIEQYFQVVLFVLDNFSKLNSRYFPQVFSTLGSVKKVFKKMSTSCQQLIKSYVEWQR